jgi:hypothetical protein
MKNKQDIEQAANQALNSLNNLQQVDANEYIHAKIMQRMSNNKVVPMVHHRLMLRLVAVLILFIGINAVSFYVLKQRGTNTEKKTTGADAFAKAYNLNNNLDSY